jgi:NADPH:quinone reductase-like Zn-dependent oxidoreductase
MHRAAAPDSILGHEAAGIVESVGEGVTSVAPGDHVRRRRLRVEARRQSNSLPLLPAWPVARHFSS